MGLLLTGCGGAGGTGLPAELESDLLSIADCTGVGLVEIIGLFEAIQELREVVADPLLTPPPWVDYDRAFGDFSVSVDFDGDGVREGEIEGVVRNPSIFDDGMDIGEVMVAVWDVTAGAVSGSGTISVVRQGATEYRVTIVERDTVLSGGNCEFRVTSMGIGLDTLLYEDEGVWGSIEFTITTAGADPFDGLMTFVLDDDVTYVMGDYRGFDFEFNIDLETFAIYF